VVGLQRISLSIPGGALVIFATFAPSLATFAVKSS
jgi:hypothetical protein